jgi:FAD synthase
LGHFIREQSAFASLDELTARIGRDVEIVRRLEL